MDALGPTSFDFWTGVWDCDFDGGHAVNTITREYGDKVIQERFVVDAPEAWQGMSVSVHDEHGGLWRQTWVDQSGSYWHFVGGLVDGDPSFGTPVPVDAEELFKRMVFSNIRDDGFDWRWESSPDGTVWTINWEIAYSRKDQTAG